MQVESSRQRARNREVVGSNPPLGHQPSCASPLSGPVCPVCSLGKDDRLEFHELQSRARSKEHRDAETKFLGQGSVEIRSLIGGS